jgi:hypothetical protein
VALDQNSEMKEIVQEAHIVVIFINNSPKCLELLESTSLTVNGCKITGHKPVPKCTTRWDFIHIMLDSILDQLFVINHTLREENSAILNQMFLYLVNLPITNVNESGISWRKVDNHRPIGTP